MPTRLHSPTHRPEWTMMEAAASAWPCVRVSSAESVNVSRAPSPFSSANRLISGVR